MRISMFCAVLAMLLAAAPASAEKQQWGFVKSDHAATLFYGVPESDDGTLSFVCEQKNKKIDIVTTALPSNARQGRSGKIKLSNSASSLGYAGKTAGDNEGAGVFLAASTAIEPRLFEFLETGTSLRIDAMGAQTSVPLAGIKGPLAQMRQACR